MKRSHAALAIILLYAAPGFAAEVRLIDAVKSVNAPAVRSLLAQRVNVNATEADGSTALDWAAQRDSIEIADLLIAGGSERQGRDAIPHPRPCRWPVLTETRC